MSGPLLRRVYLGDRLEPNWGDGVPQIAIGVFLILAMWMMLEHTTSFFVVFIPIVPLLIEGLRKRFTYPRVKRPQPQDKSPQRIMLLSLLSLLLLAGLAWTFFLKGHRLPETSSQIPWQWIVGLIAASLVTGMVIRAFQSGKKFLLWYALFLALLTAGILFMKLSLRTVEFIIMGFGGMNIIYGVISLILFVRKYPLTSDIQY